MIEHNFFFELELKMKSKTEKTKKISKIQTSNEIKTQTESMN
jgi:hypothetical protein